MFKLVTPFALLAVAAYQDWQTQKISDVVLSSLWLSLLVLAPEGLAPAAGVFAFLFAINTLSNYMGRALFGWGDILLLPPYFGFLFSFGVPWLALAGPAGMYLDVWFNKKPRPLAPYCLVAFAIGVLFIFFPSIVEALA